MKKYGSMDLVKKLYAMLYSPSLDIIYSNVDAIDFKVSIDLIGHVKVTHQRHYIVISPIEYDGSTGYIIDDMSNSEHIDYCNNLNDICTCVSTIIKSWFK